MILSIVVFIVALAIADVAFVGYIETVSMIIFWILLLAVIIKSGIEKIIGYLKKWKLLI